MSKPRETRTSAPPPPKVDVEALSEIFLKIAEAPQQRQAALLVELCPDENLRQEVMRLLDADQSTHSLLDHPLVPDPVEMRPGETIGFYKLVRELAVGGMGVVYLAEQTEPVRRQVALKVIKPGVDTRQVIARFDAERQALSMMDHPNIAKVLDAGSTENGRPFFVMELVDGQPINSYCRQRELSINQRLELFTSVCRAVQHAHQKGIIHRDIKPSNILVAEYDDQPVAKVIDFGVAKAIEQSLSEITVATGMGQIIGTVDYMSPEQSQLDRSDVDTRSDIYSLGVVLYDLLTDTPPFDRDRLRSADLQTMLNIIREEDPPRPSVRLAEVAKAALSESQTQARDDARTLSAKRIRLVRGELDWIVMRAMEKDRSHRYATPIGLANDIQRFLSGEPVAACPPSSLYRFRKFVNRNKTALATSTVVVASLLVGCLGVAFQTIRASRAESKANVAAFEFIIENVLGSDGSQASTGYSPDPNLKLLILLKNASNEVDEKFSGEPELKAKMKSTLANLFNSVGNYDDARKLYNDYLAYLETNNGPNDPDTLDVMRKLVRLSIEESRFGDAETLGTKALQNSRTYLGIEHPITLGLVSDLAMLHHKTGETSRAIEAYQQVIEVQQRRLGESHPATLMAVSDLATVLDSEGRYKESQALHERVLQTFEQSLSPRDARLATAYQRTGRCYLIRGRRTESKQLFEEASWLLRKSQELYVENRGEEHTDTLDSQFQLAQCLLELRKLDEAKPLLEDLVARLARLRAQTDQMRLQATNMLSWTYLHQTQYAEAEYLLTSAYETLRQDSPTDYLTLQVMGNLAIARFRMGKVDEAVLLDEKAVQRCNEELGPNHNVTIAAKRRLAIGYSYQGRDHPTEASSLHLPKTQFGEGEEGGD